MKGPVNNSRLRVLVLEPYYGGSHRAFLSGLSRLPFAFDFMTLPARKWKWRMRLAAPYFADKLHETKGMYDRILCSTFVDVAAFRGLAPAWVRKVPLLTYFHENQFEYPVRAEDGRDFHFSLTNMTTALASDCIAFNSRYNLSSFIDGIRKLEKKSYDLKLEDPCSLIRAKAKVIPPGVDFRNIDEYRPPGRGAVPVILWNHRWEHDKNPAVFFRAIYKLDSEGNDFRLVVLGESFKDSPTVFAEARERLSSKLLHFGYVRSRKEYARWLRKCDIVVSTSLHEFFGISVLEAVRAGCRPLLPRRLSYPELFPPEFLYDEEEFFKKLGQCITKKKRLSAARALELTGRFSWESLLPEYELWITGARVLSQA